jgi:hypothetical protein
MPFLKRERKIKTTNGLCKGSRGTVKEDKGK